VEHNRSEEELSKKLMHEVGRLQNLFLFENQLDLTINDVKSRLYELFSQCSTLEYRKDIVEIFSVFIYLIHEQCKGISAEDYYCLYEKLDDKILIEYLETIKLAIQRFCEGSYDVTEKLMDEAIAIYPDYEIPYYFKAIALGRGKSDIDRDKILDCLGRLEHDTIIAMFNSQAVDTPYRYLPLIDNNQGLDWIEILLEFNEKIKENTKELDKLNQNSKNMLRRYAHSWSNLLYPEIIENAINGLISIGGYSEEASELRRAFENEILFSQQSYILQSIHENTSEEAYITNIVEGVNTEGEGKGIEYYISFCLERAVKRLFNESKGYEINKCSFLDEVVRGNTDIFEWFKAKCFPFCLGIDENWSTMKIDFNSSAMAFFCDIFISLFVNMLEYGDFSSGNCLKVDFDTEEMNACSYLTIYSRIGAQHQTEAADSSSIGFIEQLLQKINKPVFTAESKDDTRYLLSGFDNDSYYVKLYIRKNLFLLDKRVFF